MPILYVFNVLKQAQITGEVIISRITPPLPTGMVGRGISRQSQHVLLAYADSPEIYSD